LHFFRSSKPPQPDTSGDNNEEEISEYERLRLANIARNASVMVELGLDGHPTSGRHRRGNSSNNHSSSRSTKRPKLASPPSVPERRSTRAAGLPAPNYKEVPAFRISDLEGRNSGGRSRVNDGGVMVKGEEGGNWGDDDAESHDAQFVHVPRPSMQLPPDAASSRAMYCNLDALLGAKQLGRAVRE